MKRLTVCNLCLLLSLVCWLPPTASAGASLAVQDFRGHQVKLDRPATRAVCLIESALSGLYMLGVQESVVGVSTNMYQQEVHRYYAAMDSRIANRELPTPGNWDFVNIESVVGLRPDLVIIWASQTEAITALLEKSIAVYAVELASFDDVFKEIRDLGVLFGAEARADELVRFTQKELNGLRAAKERIPESRLPGVYFMWAQGPLETSGAASTVNELIELAGGRNVAAHLTQEHLIVNLENLLSWQPQAIVMWYNPRLSTKELAAMPVWQTLPAAQTDRIFQLPSVFFCDLWTLKFLYAARLMAYWLHPEVRVRPDTVAGKRSLLVSLYGEELGGRIPLVE